MTYSLEAREVHKRYGEFAAVKGVSFRVRQGSCFGILGPNGAGKTSLLAMIEGIAPITAGSISVLGMDVATQIKQIQPRIGVQLQQNNYFQFLTVEQLLKFYQELRASMSGSRAVRPIEPLLGRLGLMDKLNFKVDELSGGQKQRLSIAIALLEDPEVVFLDEPTSALDPQSRLYTWEFIEQLQQDASKTIVLTTHYMEEAERLCDDIMIMNDGHIIAQGNPAELVSSLPSRHAVEFQFARGQFKIDFLQDLLSSTDHEWNPCTDRLRIRTAKVMETLHEILALSAAQRVAVLDCDISRPTLEDVFLSHTGTELRE